MALKLTKLDPGLFSGKKGEIPRFEIRTTTDGESADLIGIHYVDQTDNAPPWEVTLQPGDNGIVFLVFASRKKARLVIEEVDADDSTNRQIVSVSFYDPAQPFDVFTVQVKP